MIDVISYQNFLTTITREEMLMGVIKKKQRSPFPKKQAAKEFLQRNKPAYPYILSIYNPGGATFTIQIKHDEKKLIRCTT